MDTHRAVPSTGHSGMSPRQQHTHIPYHHTSSSTHYEPGPTPTNTSAPLNPFPRLPCSPSSFFRCSKVPQVPSKHYLRTWCNSSLEHSCPRSLANDGVSGDFPHIRLGVTGYGIHLSHLHAWSEHQMHVKLCCIRTLPWKKSPLRTHTWAVGGGHELPSHLSMVTRTQGGQRRWQG